MPLKIVSLVFLLLTIIGYVNGQETNKISFLADVEQQAINSFTNKLINHNTIYNGKMYIPNSKSTDNGHPMFISNQYVDGSVSINQYNYNHVNLQYNLVSNEIILLNYDKTGGVILSIDDIQQFNLHGHQFVFIKPNSNQQNVLTAGFYDELYKGLSISLMAKRVKKVEVVTTESGVKSVYTQQNKYYILKNNTFYPVKNDKDLLTVLADKKDLLTKYAKSNKLNFRNNQENSIYELVKYADTLR